MAAESQGVANPSEVEVLSETDESEMNDDEIDLGGNYIEENDEEVGFEENNDDVMLD